MDFSLDFDSQVEQGGREKRNHQSRKKRTIRKILRTFTGHREPPKKKKESKKKRERKMAAIAPSTATPSMTRKATKSLKKLKKEAKNVMPWLPAYSGFRERIFALLDTPDSSKLSKMFSLLVIFLIVLSSLNFIIETLPPFKPESGIYSEKASPVFQTIEAVCIYVFTFEYLGRLFTVSSWSVPLSSEEEEEEGEGEPTAMQKVGNIYSTYRKRGKKQKKSTKETSKTYITPFLALPPNYFH